MTASGGSVTGRCWRCRKRGPRESELSAPHDNERTLWTCAVCERAVCSFCAVVVRGFPPVDLPVQVALDACQHTVCSEKCGEKIGLRTGGDWTTPERERVKITMVQTDRFVEHDGVRLSEWVGHLQGGVRVTVFVHHLAIDGLHAPGADDPAAGIGEDEDDPTDLADEPGAVN